MMMMRLPGMPLGMLGDRLHKWIPDLPPSSAGGPVRNVVRGGLCSPPPPMLLPPIKPPPSQHCHFLEPSCAPKLCSVIGGGMKHISWVSNLDLLLAH